MPRLRGSRQTVVSRQIPLDYKLSQLERKIGRNKPSVENYRKAYVNTATGAGFYTFQNALTDDFFASTLYDELVLGDKFVNERLQINFHANPNCIKMRICVYFSKRPGTAFIPALTATGFTTPMDPAAFTVLFDNTYLPSTTTSGLCPIVRIPLKGYMTTINRSNSTVERGELFVTVTLETIGATGVTSNTQHFLRNK